MTVYLIDTSVMVQAENQSYRFGEFPGYWDWMRLQASIGRLAVVAEVKEELCSQPVTEWVNSLPRSAIRYSHGSRNEAFLQIREWVRFHPRFSERAKDEFLTGADPHLISEAIAQDGTVVTYEVTAPNAMHSIKIPDVCREFNVDCIFPHDMLAREGARFILDPAVRDALVAQPDDKEPRTALL